jgi:hypothetical protein
MLLQFNFLTNLILLSMKKQFLSSFFKLTLLVLMGTLIFVGCKDDDDDDPPIVVLDGFYIKGAATALPDLADNGRMSVARNEVNQTDRADLFEMYIPIKAGTDGFNIIMVKGDTLKTYGPGADFALVPEAELDVEEPKEGLWKGSLVETETKFTVPEDAMYHVMFDRELMKIAIAKVVWGVIGGATPGGWSESTPMTAGTFNLNQLTFEVAEILLLENEYKFRYSNGWKIILDADYDLGGGSKGIKLNTNFGGAVDALVPGGGNIVNDTYGVWKFTMTWKLGEGTKATKTWVKDGEPLPEYPETLFMIGATVGGWDWATIDLPMIPVHSHPELFWKIVWMEAGVADGGFKFAPNKEWVGDFGKTGDATNGVYAKGGENVPGPDVTGFYMVVVDLENETIEVNAPTVYMIGDAVGSWDAGVPANMFTVDNANSVVTITKDLAAGNLRMYAAASTLAADWWQAEFMIFNNIIEYRATGGDQTAVPVTAGNYTINLNFKDNSGSVTQN